MRMPTVDGSVIPRDHDVAGVAVDGTFTIDSTTPSSIVEDAASWAQKESLADLVEYLLSTIGPRLTAVGAGLSDARQLNAWRKGETPRNRMGGPRVRAVAEFAVAVMADHEPEVAANFLRSSQPALDDASPLILIADAEDDTELVQVQKRVRAAARAFIAG